MSITETGSGTYENLSLAAFADVAHTNNQEELSITTLSVYPNPVTDCIFIHGIIDATIEKVNLMSMNGKIVYSAKIEDLKSENTGTTLKIPVKNINAGIFNLEIIQSDRRTNFKVIIP